MTYLWWALYAAAAACLVAYGFHAAYLLSWAKRRGPEYRLALERCRAESTLLVRGFPRVLVQLPVYNEPRVVVRLVEAVEALDWPREALEVQLLDDSTDQTSEVARRAVEAARSRGLVIDHVQRARRTGFKAGALARGMSRSDAPFIAILDADFTPLPDFLHRALPLFDLAPKVACVQGRWTHLNPDQNFLTRGQAVAVDAHFLVQQLARAAGGGLCNFNGSAGIWRREAIDDSGGWSSATLTEDLDLSLRAHMRGWRIVFDPSLVVPGELPPTLSAFKSQQARWACGSIQCARRIVVPLWKSGLPLRAKVEATMHMGGYSVCLAMVFLAISLPLGIGHLSLIRETPYAWPLWVAIWFAALGPVRVSLHAQRAAGGRRSLVATLRTLVLGFGMAANNAIAVVRGLLWPIREFVRTPKQGGGRASSGTLPRTEIAFAAITAGAAIAVASMAPASFAAYVVFCSSGSWVLMLYWWLCERRPARSA